MPLILCTPDTGTVLCIFLVHKQSFVLSAGPLHNTGVGTRYWQCLAETSAASKAHDG